MILYGSNTLTLFVMRNTIIEKSRRRLLVLTIGTLFVSLFGGGLFALNQWQSDKQYQLMRREVQMAMQQGRYDDAIEQLTHGLAFWPGDSLLLQDYVIAQKHVRDSADQNLTLTIEVLSRSMQSNPHMQQAAEQLVSLHMVSGDAAQALKVADFALEHDPDNTQMIKRRALAYIRIGDFKQAIDDVDQCIVNLPTDYDLYLLRLYLAKLQNVGAPLMTELVASWRPHLQNEAWYQALMGVNCRLNQLHEQAISWFTQAASQKLDDPRLIQLLIGQLDSLGQYQIVDGWLETVDVQQMPTLLYDKAWRLWQNKSDQSLLKLEHQDQPAVMALQIFACKRTGQAQRGDHLLLRLANLPSTTANRNWLKLIHLLVNDVDSHPLQRIEAARQVRMTCSNHDLAEVVLAQQYEKLGEQEASLDVWRTLSNTTPRWTMPHLQQSRLLLETDHPMAAAAAARKALACDPRSIHAGVLLIEALLRSDRESTQQMAHSVFNDMADSLSADTRLLLQARLFQPLEVRLSVDQAIDQRQVITPETWLELAQISLERQGDWHDACLAQFEQHHPITPLWMLLKAKALQNEGQDIAARELINQTVQSQTLSQPEQVLSWQLAQAKYLTTTTDLLASHIAWQHLLEKYPHTLSVCQAILSLPRAQCQPQLREQAVRQLKALTGPYAIRWRYEQAALMLDQSRDNTALSQATLLLHDALKCSPSAMNCRVLLMQCLQMIGSEQGVLEQAHAILNIDPYHPQAMEILKQARS